jgi:signal transduction histidine kinase
MFNDVSEQLATYLLQHSSAICLILRRDGLVLNANPHAYQVSGKDPVGLELNDLFVNFNNTRTIDDYLAQANEKVLVNVVSEGNTPITFYFRFYDLGEKILAIGQIDDREVEILGRNFLELNKELGNLTRELQKKNAALKKLNEQKNLFLGIAAHDLRNPLGVIMGFSEILTDELDQVITSDQKYMLNSITESTEFMLKLIINLLDYSAIESGNLKLEKKTVDVKSLMDRCISYNQIIAAKKEIKIYYESDEPVLMVAIDPTKIEAAINNLLGNAIKFSYPNSIVNVRTTVENGELVVSVKDHGQGIPPEEKGKLFKPFVTTSVRGTSGERSTGLGLSITHDIIKRHSGRIYFESELNVGSTFYFTLPISN